MTKLKCVIIRGGTSRGVYFHENELPSDPTIRDKVILDVLGSPDVREIDGLGGADILTSKVCIISPCKRDDADINYTFGEVIVDKPIIDYRWDCGNLASGAGPFAIDEGLIKPVEPVTKVRIYNTNTKKVLISEVPVKDGKALVEGDYRIDGVPGTGAKIALDFAATAGTIKGVILPTGKVKEVLTIDGIGNIEISIVDAGNPTVFTHAQNIGIKGTETFKELLLNSEIWKKAELIHKAAGGLPGFAALPFFTAFVSEPSTYVNYVSGEAIKAENMDIRSVIWAAGEVHKAYPITGTICTGTAAMVEGTIVNQFLKDTDMEEKVIRIGHPSGIIKVDVEVEKKGDDFALKKAVLNRTARRIMEGYVYLKPWTLTQDSHS